MEVGIGGSIRGGGRPGRGGVGVGADFLAWVGRLWTSISAIFFLQKNILLCAESARGDLFKYALFEVSQSTHLEIFWSQIEKSKISRTLQHLFLFFEKGFGFFLKTPFLDSWS